VYTINNTKGDQMKFIGIRDFRIKSSKIWNDLKREKEIVITLNGKPMAIISSVLADNFEEDLATIRRARAMSAIDYLQRKSIEKGTLKLTLEEINNEIKEVRKKKPK
jgi:antitoxin (DNA-binding transcriptional repressor) of toxin-antitoxin stability system